MNCTFVESMDVHMGKEVQGTIHVIEGTDSTKFQELRTKVS